MCFSFREVFNRIAAHYGCCLSLPTGELSRLAVRMCAEVALLRERLVADARAARNVALILFLSPLPFKRSDMELAADVLVVRRGTVRLCLLRSVCDVNALSPM